MTQDVPDWSQQVEPTVPTVTQTYLSAAIAESASGANEVIAAVAGKQIVVCGYVLVASAAVNAKWQSDGSPTDLTGLLYMTGNGGAVAPFNQNGWFRTLINEALDLNLSAAVPVGGHLVYALV